MFPIYENLSYKRTNLPLILYHLETIENSVGLIKMKNYTCLEERESITGACCIDYRHWHSSLEILLICKDGSEVLLNGEVVSPSAGDILLIDAFDIHTIVDEHAHYVVLIDPSQIPAIQDDMCLFPLLVKDKWIRKNGAHESFRAGIENHVYTLRDQLEDESRNNILGIRGEILLLLDTVHAYSQALGPQRDGTSNQKATLKKIFNFIEQNFKENIVLSDMAQVAGFTESYFCRFFKGATGRTLFEYLNEYRCHMAQSRLENSKDSITEIALETGFSSVSYFSRIFKGHFGLSPRAYRENLKNE